MAGRINERSPIKGKTYSLYADEAHTDHYYRLIRKITDSFLRKCPDEKELLLHIQHAGAKSSLIKKLARKKIERALVLFIRETLKDSLSVYTTAVSTHLKNIPVSQKLDPIIKTKEYQYHLYMVEIELINRIYRDAFIQSRYKFALIAHCLRDFRPECRAVSGDYESICRGCTKECFVNLGSMLLKKYDIHPYISVSMDLDKIFEQIKTEHGSVGALGIACVPELAMGSRLCIKLDIPPLGIPLDANRCARWMKKAHESTFNIKELDRLLRK
ncbi:MAG: DUF116 domain-containing protein [Nitrospirota bacterium]